MLAAVLLFRAFQALFQGEEARVRKFILQGKKAVQERNILSCASMVAYAYADKYGNDRQGLLFAAKNLFSYYQDIFIKINNLEIKINKSRNEAEVNITASILCRLPDNTAEHIFEKEEGKFLVRLSKEDKGWKLQEIEFLEDVSVMGQKVS